MNLAEIRAYLQERKEALNYSWADLSAESGIPETTIRKIFSGATESPSYENISKLLDILGPRPDEITHEADRPAAENTEEDMTEALRMVRESYESRIADLKETYDKQITAVKEALQHTIHILTAEKNAWRITAAIIGTLLAALVIADLCIGTRGWILY